MGEVEPKLGFFASQLIDFSCFVLPLSLRQSIMETSYASLAFESVDEILWCDHSIEPSLTVLSPGTVCFSIFFKLKFGIFLDFWLWTLLGVKGLMCLIYTNNNSL